MINSCTDVGVQDMLDIQISKHSGTGTNAGPQPNCGTRKRVSAEHAARRDTHGRLARRQARDQRRILLPSPLRGRNLPPEHDISLVRQ